ncbi:MAG: lipopolysaccharide transport periplasmic protein LptA [Proteobacteria bacterium]|nr:lipopolysaccharide transport periplasmic protein LptA [Pseudomonadota bacterium]MBU1687009.1 lipopolysaccharide transport periplasmic protein LptA [Pseudomonadota bacterium]
MLRFIVLFLLVALLVPGLSMAAEDTAASREPIHIEADRMEADRQKDAVFFNGNVEASQGALAIRADRMTVYYSDPEKEDSPGLSTGPTSARSITRLQAVGNVEIIKEGWVAAGDLVDYFSNERKVVLSGNTRVWQENNMVTGDRVILFLDEGRSIIEKKDEEGGRVKAFFYPESTPEKTPGQ